MFYEFAYLLEENLFLGTLTSLLSGIPSFTVSVAAYILSSLALYTIAQRRALKHAWLSWVPVGNIWILGSISDQYSYVAKGQVKSKRKILLVLNVVFYLLVFTLAVVFGAMVVRMVTVGIMAGPDEIMDGVFGSLATMLGLCVPLFGVFIAMKVIRFMALFDVYASCDPENRVIFLVLSILIGISEPILLFICRNKDGGMPPRRPVPEYTQPVYEAPAEESDDQETEM